MNFTDKPTQYKILNLYVSDVKGIQAIDITPDSNVVKIKGKNGQGKSSILDSILYGIAGNREVPSEAVRHDAEQGIIKIDFGDFAIEKIIKKDASPKLKITTPEGMTYKSPQTVLREMSSSLSFDPLEFCDMKPEEQRDELAGLLGIREKLNEFIKKYDDLYESRKDAGKTKRLFDSRLKDTPTALPVSDEELKKMEDEIFRLKNSNTELKIVENEVESLKTKIESNKAEYEEIYKRLMDIKAENEKLLPKLVELEKKALIMELPSETEIEVKQEEYEKKIASREKQRAYDKAKEDVVEWKDKYDSFTQELDQVKIDINKLASSVEAPIEGLAIDETGIRWNETSLENLSTTEKLKIGLQIIVKQNPKLRVVLIERGESIDEDGMKVLAEIAEKENLQIWIEIVTSDVSGDGFYITEGKAEDHPF